MPVYNYITLDDPLARGVPMARGIDDVRQSVGEYGDGTGKTHGFLDSGGRFTTIDDPFTTTSTIAGGINDGGQVVGYYQVGNPPHSHGFLFNRSSGGYITLDDPSATFATFARGINDAGQIVGQYNDASGGHGFFYNPNTDTYTTLNDPSATFSTEARGINASGQIVGSYDSGTHGFLLSGVKYTTLDYPLAVLTAAIGINDAGQIVGYFFDDQAAGGIVEGGVGPAAIKKSVPVLVLDWQVMGFGNFSSRGENDMILRNANNGGVEVYDIANNQITGAAFLGPVG